jgi:FkbM family methyltransferase
MMTLKQKIQNIFFPLGTVQKIRMGYLKGYKIRLTENSMWSPLIGRWEPAMQKVMVNVVKEGHIAYDLGANNGLHGLLLSQLVGKKGIVYNFEPFEENIAEMNENFRMNKITNYENVHAAVSDSNGVVSFVMGDHNKQGAIEIQKGHERTIRVKSVSLDNFIEQGNPGPHFVKIDIEGAEGSALKGFTGNVEKFFPLMIIELHNPTQDSEVGKFLSFFKYKAYRFHPFKNLKFTEIKDLSKPYPAPEGIWGTLFCIGPGRKLENFTFDK